MSFRSEAYADLNEIMNDPDTGGEPCTITSPAGVSVEFKTLSNDITLSFDPDTGQSVTGRQATVSVLISELIAAGFSGICGVADKTARPWVVDAIDVNGVAGKFKVSESNPDNSIGLMLLFLELYQ